MMSPARILHCGFPRVSPLIPCLYILLSLLPTAPVSAQSPEADLVSTKLIRFEALSGSLPDTGAADLRLVLQELETTIREAMNAQDWISAEILLDEALAQLAAVEASPAPAAVVPAATWKPERSLESGVTAGMEYAEYDSAGTPVPYAQARTQWRMPVLRWQGDVSAEARYYYDDRFTLSGYTGLSRHAGPWSFVLENEILRETNADTSVKPYFENTLDADAGYRFNSLLQAGSDLQAAGRRYDTEDSTDYNYLTLQERAWLRFDDRNGLSIDAGAAWGTRVTELDTDNDYHEFTADIMIDRYFGWTNRILIGSDHTVRDYFTADDTASYSNDYTEHLIYGEGQLGIADRVRLKLGVQREQRTYKLPATYAPDTKIGQIVPGIVWDIRDNLSLGLAAYYEVVLHEAADTAGTAADYANGEDYTSRALELSCDFFLADRFFISASDKYEMKTYTHPEKSDINQDSNTNSLILFLTWKINGNLELSVSTFQDNEDARAEGDLDASTSELLNYTAELTYSF